MILKKNIITVFFNKDKKNQLMDYFYKYMKWTICVAQLKKWFFEKDKILS
jgi:hypothetical protein